MILKSLIFENFIYNEINYATYNHNTCNYTNDFDEFFLIHNNNLNLNIRTSKTVFIDNGARLPKRGFPPVLGCLISGNHIR